MLSYAFITRNKHKPIIQMTYFFKKPELFSEYFEITLNYRLLSRMHYVAALLPCV